MSLHSGELPRRGTTIVLTLLLLAGLAFLWVETAKFARPLVVGAPSAALFPRGVIVVLIAAVGLILLRELRGRDEDEKIEVPFGGVAIAILAPAAWALSVPYAGFEIPTLLFVTALLAIHYRLWASIVAGFATVLVAWAVFVIALQIHIPLLILPQYLS